MPSINTNHDRMNKTVAASGAVTFSCGDTVASLLAGRPLEVVQALAERNGIDPSKYTRLNAGHQRMILGNMLRKKFRETVAVREETHDDDATEYVTEMWGDIIDAVADQGLAQAA